MIGVWLHPNERIHIEITHCGDEYCGKIIWLKNPTDARGEPLTDLKNPDPILRTRPLIGLLLLHDLHQVDERTWEGGVIYNPDDGTTYRTRMEMQGDGTVSLRAYILFPLLGETLVWTRVP